MKRTDKKKGVFFFRGFFFSFQIFLKKIWNENLGQNPNEVFRDFSFGSEPKRKRPEKDLKRPKFSFPIFLSFSFHADF